MQNQTETPTETPTQTETKTPTKFEEWLDAVGLKHEQHQKDAVAWCVQRENAANHKGGIIADEMGLGKTIEILGTIKSNPVEGTLIVLPYSLLGQWVSIITNLFGVAPLVFHGNQRARYTAHDLISAPVVLTTYGLITQKKKGLVKANPLYTIPWGRVIYDEAHHLRNKKTGVKNGALQLKTGITWLMTGTPVQNSATDVYSLYNLLGFTADKFIESNLPALIREYMLRRTKESAGIILPTCHSAVIEVVWNYEKEKNLAEDIHTRLGFSNLSMLHSMQETTGEPSTFKSTLPSEGDTTFKTICRAKKMCVFPKLLKTSLRKLMLTDGGGIETPQTITEMLRRSSKLDAVVAEVLKNKGNGKPKLIFCYFHEEMDELESLLTAQEMQVKKFDGRTSKKGRADILHIPSEVLIAQIDAANEGLNLQAYKEVYMVSPQWNPAIEDQAVARCHRIGQTEEVKVFRFLMSGFAGYEALKDAPKALTLDEHIRNVQLKKREMIKKILEGEVPEAETKPVPAEPEPAKSVSVKPVPASPAKPVLAKKKRLILVNKL